jgi:ribonucleoside-diphosphate reductase alpha chain
VDGKLSNMNISVAITDKFMRAFKDNIPYELKSPSDGEPVSEINARQIWDNIIDMAWKTGDPGIIFIDTMNKYNTLQKIMLIQATNPCGEQPLGPYLACNLSSININEFCVNKQFNFDMLYKTSYDIMNYMDNLIDVMEFPDERFKVNVMKYRPVGIGLMGLADTMFELDIPYDSVEGRTFAGEVMKTITTACIEASADRAKEFGSFERYEDVKDDVLRILAEHTDNNEFVMNKVRKYGVRNSQFTTAAPTGTTALSCDCSYGIEPSFGLIFQKTLVETGETVTIVNPIFKNRFENEAWYTPDLVEKIIANKGSLKGIRGIPKEVRDVFVVAHDIKFKDRIDLQSELQKYCSTGISSTLNLPSTTTRDEVSELYRYAYQKGLKGVTIYRDGSKKSQPITFTKDKTQVQSNFVRPNVLKANVHTLETGNGKLYITISTHNGKPVEIFMSMGKSGQIFNVFSEALGRSISIALQHGVPIESIIKTMIGINSDRPTWARFEENDRKPMQILSIPDGIAKLLQRYYTKDGLDEEVIDGTRDLCPKCGTYSVIFMEGCKICQNCNLSECS